MSLRILTRKIRIELLSIDEDICHLLFIQKKAQKACRLFLEELKRHDGLTRVEISKFASDLNDGKIEFGFTYARTNFYGQIRRALLTLGLMGIEQRFVGPGPADLAPKRTRRKNPDVVEKYVPVWQPIPKRPPDGLNLPRYVWIVCKKWNDEFLPGFVVVKSKGAESVD